MENPGFPGSTGAGRDCNEKALEIINDAANQKNYPDLIKGKIFHYKFYQIKNESAASYILKDLNKSISNLPSPYSNVLLSYKADFLKQYYDDNLWNNWDRKETNDPDPTDLETWSNPILLDSIASAFYRSLENEEVLIKTPIENFEDLLQQKKLNRRYRPTLFDLLTHQALDFFSDSSNLTATGAVDQYVMKYPNLYAPTFQFLKLEFSKDAPSSHQRVLRLFQKLESLHTETAPLYKNNTSTEILPPNNGHYFYWVSNPVVNGVGFKDTAPIIRFYMSGQSKLIRVISNSFKICDQT